MTAPNTSALPNSLADLQANAFPPIAGADEDLVALAQCYRLARERARAARLAAQPAEAGAPVAEVTPASADKPDGLQ